MRGAILLLALLATTLVAACGGMTSDDTSKDASSDGLDAAFLSDGVSACAAPGGLMLCGGTCGNPCPVDSTGAGCVSEREGQPQELGVCDVGIFEISTCDECSDSHVCVFGSVRDANDFGPDSSIPNLEMASMACADVAYAEMYALNGRPDLARYADRSTYTNEPLPTPASCPNVGTLRLCGGACGDCPSGYICIGRSPLHPYSVCVNDFTTKVPPPNTPTSCIRNLAGWCSSNGPGLQCLTFKVDAASQTIADENSICVDKAICQAAAVAYPGGAFCTP